MIRASVSDLDLYRAYRDDEDFSLEEFLSQLYRRSARTAAMDRGHAFALAMQDARLGESSTISAEGHTFAFTCDAEIEAWPRREEKREKDYGGIIVTARCDRIMGRIIADDKTTGQFDAESYIEKFQWRLYLDIFGADVFRWHVWECREVKDPEVIAWEVYAHHLLTQYRYQELEHDCRNLAHDFADFALRIGWEGRTDRSSADLGALVLP
jgi:hypothetical protein